MDFTIPHRTSRISIGPTIVLQRNNLLKCPTLEKTSDFCEKISQRKNEVLSKNVVPARQTLLKEREYVSAAYRNERCEL